MTSTTSPVATERRERTESARLDNFVDGAFAFAITLLIISGGNLPKNVISLYHALLSIPAFAACFWELAWFWHGHVRWRDTAQLTDRTSLMLSLLLVFFALIFVFPLHLMFSEFFNGISNGVLSPDFGAASRNENIVNTTRGLFTFYGLSFACMSGTLALLYRHGARARAAPDRDAAITLRLRVVLWSFVAAVGLLSMLIALAMPPRAGWFQGLPGSTYFLLALIGPLMSRYRRRLQTSLPP